jgi:hypothetical protein
LTIIRHMTTGISAGRPARGWQWVSAALLLLSGVALCMHILTTQPGQTGFSFYLGLMAALFGASGFMLYPLCFPNRSSGAGQPALGADQAAVSGSAHASDGTECDQLRHVIETLQQQIADRDHHMQTLKSLADQQVEEIKVLQADAEAIRQAFCADGMEAARQEQVTPGLEIVGNPKSSESGQAAGEKMETAAAPISQSPDSSGTPAGTAARSGIQKDSKRTPRQPVVVPGTANWKSNLDNILDFLDSMEDKKR